MNQGLFPCHLMINPAEYTRCKILLLSQESAKMLIACEIEHECNMVDNILLLCFRQTGIRNYVTK